MQFLPFSFEKFPSYDEPIDGAITIKGDTNNYRIRVFEVPYQEDCNLRILVPQKQMEGEMPWGGPADVDDEDYYKAMERYPLIVHVQGSGWMPQDMNDHIHDFGPIVRAGYAIALVQYHGAPEAQFPQQVIDTKRALRYISQHADRLPIDMEKVYLSGDSSGGHTMLLTLLTYDSKELDDENGTPLPALIGALDFYGVTDFNTFNDWWSREDAALSPNQEALMGENYRDEARKAECSPVSYIREDLSLVPLLILHGSKDTVVPFTQSLEFYQKLKEAGHEDVTLVRISGADHGGSIFFCDETYEMIFRFLSRCK